MNTSIRPGFSGSATHGRRCAGLALRCAPLNEQKLGDDKAEIIADADDIENLRAVLSDDFGGTTILLPVMGYGLRDPQDLASLELNRNLPFDTGH
jgi:hypothetical protein